MGRFSGRRGNRPATACGFEVPHVTEAFVTEACTVKVLSTLTCVTHVLTLLEGVVHICQRGSGLWTAGLVRPAVKHS